jgi:phosphoserine aminotransferase
MKLNFGAGPAHLPTELSEQLQAALYDWEGTGYSILSQPFRNAKVEAIIDEIKSLVITLCKLPHGQHDVLLMQGGARLQFAMLPLNYLAPGSQAAYIHSGYWAASAKAEADRLGNAVWLGMSHSNPYDLPNVTPIDNSHQYVHITTNNTIEGTQFKNDVTCDSPLFADMSSDILSFERDFNKYAISYACAQKQLGAAGTSLVIINKNTKPSPAFQLPQSLSYAAHIAANSMFTTPNLFGIYTTLLMLRWVKSKGGISTMQAENEEKAALLYTFIEAQENLNLLTAEGCRSLSNITFKATNERIHAKILQTANDCNIVGIEGHRSVGGFRVSNYNAITKSMILKLIDCLQTCL